ncbi:CMRF35-like molecule 1 isoform X2 [Etheostoma cragini]|uniref:CMRF35-like molecule 1 isoform X2 n=1 Tax=Etheostoma cragini TaxID=417921 RepID=UPI00155F4F96|nr:CMRF35-like molecule 1 isoform X2 [Etheostoma cragini]
MAVHLIFLLFLTGLTGIHSITTVSEVSVKAGSSISIPCLYGVQYTNHVKYLCKGYHWHSCSYIVKTNQHNSGRFWISDNKTQSIFTVTIHNLADEDTDYWCAVEINGGADIKEYFHLSVTRDTSHLYVDQQEITTFNGNNITINCYYINTGEMKWCRLGSSCVTRSSGSIDGTKVTISGGMSRAFTVTMSGLRTESSSWYWCAKGDLQMPVYVTVRERPIVPTTTTVATTSHLTTLSPETVSASDLKHFLIPLSLLIFIVTVLLLIWFMLKRHKQTRADSSATRKALDLGGQASIATPSLWKSLTQAFKTALKTHLFN